MKVSWGWCPRSCGSKNTLSLIIKIKCILNIFEFSLSLSLISYPLPI